MKTFHEFLKEKGVDVFEGRMPVDQAKQVVKLELEYAIEKARKKGLPKELKPFAKKVVAVIFDGMQRQNQDPTKFGCSLEESSKNYDIDDTWNGTVKGTVTKVWTWALAESGFDPEEIAACVQDALEQEEE